jgi:S1-C subfamily serine protease
MPRLSVRPSATAALIIALFALAATDAVAQKMHRWVDEDGQVHFSQTPPPDQENQESEIVSYGEEDKSGQVDRACCGELRDFARAAAGYMQQGLTITEIQQRFPPSDYPYLTEVVNFISFNAASGENPSGIGSRAFSACMNRSFQACRVDGQPGGAPGTSVAGSGTVIGRDLVVTNHHVAGRCSRVTISESGEEAELIASDSGTDLAVLRAELADVSPVTLTASPRPRLGQSIFVAGYPLSSVLASLNFTTGTVSSENAVKGSNTLFQISAPIQPGNSGGPVFDSGGRLVGIVVSRLADAPIIQRFGSVPQNVNFAISAIALKTFLREHDIAFREGPSDGSLSSEALAGRAKRNTVRVFCHR